MGFSANTIKLIKDVLLPNRDLGLLSGTDVTNDELKDQVRQQYEQRLKHWSFRVLSWSERLIIIRSILRALQGYTLLSLGINKDLTPKKLEFRIECYLSWNKADDTLKLLKKARFSSGLDLQPTGTHRLSFVEFVGNVNIRLLPRESQLLTRLDWEFPPHMARPIQLHMSDGWCWEGPPLHIASTWSPSTHRLKILLHKETKDLPSLMVRWGTVDNPREATVD
ncbi:hypothetical protein R1sor_005642 [Riccia sorocarpa]|uniref:Reverse transcriptase n=1 Tax=Riccia sorocarpa TaxID=122646 RepID=A0ABD3HPE5_9MARC